MLKKIINQIKKHATKTENLILVLIATAIDCAWFKFKFSRKGYASPGDFDRLEVIKTLKKDGICLIENYWTKDRCDIAIEEIERLLKEAPEFIHPGSRADMRIFGAENISSKIKEFTVDVKLTEIASIYNCQPTKAAFTLAAKLSAIPGNKGSGDGWHRDALLRQFKAIIYLSDVDGENGPFQFIKNSHKFWWILKDIFIGKLKYRQYRIEDNQIRDILGRSHRRLQTYAAKAGTLILVDTSAIHRGMPIIAGVRYALTNYFYPKRFIDKQLFEQFAPIAGVIDAQRNFKAGNQFSMSFHAKSNHNHPQSGNS
jgi:hypothetical protein